MVNLSAQILFHASRTPDRLAIVYADQRISYGQLADRVLRMAGFLKTRGVKPGQVVAVVMKNSAAFLEIVCAVSHVGAVFLPVNFRLSASEIGYIVKNSGAVLLMADAEYDNTVQGILDATVLVDDLAQKDTRSLAGDAEKPDIEVRQPDDLFRLMYTSGTTGLPKGVMHTYLNFYWKCMDHIAVLGLTDQERVLIVGPLYHVGAFDLPGLVVLYLGGVLVVQRDFEEEEVFSVIEREHITGVWLAPVMVGRLLAHKQNTKHDLSSFRWCIGGGEKTPENRIRMFSEVFANGRYIDAYGLTETCGGDTFMEAGKEIEKIGSTGRALPHVQIQIVDDHGNPLPPEENGEICLRGPKITRGYWEQEEKTRQSFFDGWFRSGDVGHLDADGFLYLTDRKKDMIISGGENISSSEVERVIFMMPQVADVAVIGLPDERWGESVTAVVALRDQQTLTQGELVGFCRQHLARFKVPKSLVISDALPRNPSGKVLKRVLREQMTADSKSNQEQ